MERNSRIWISDADCRLEDFRRAVERHTRLADYPLASAVHSNVLTYQGDDIRKAAAKPESRAAMQAEWARANEMHLPADSQRHRTGLVG